MSNKSGAELVGFEFETDDLDYLMKRKASNNITEKEDDHSLLPEMYEEILVKLPAQYLYQDLRLVCKSWNNIISRKNFILDNFSRTKPVFLVQCDTLCRRSYCMEIDEQDLSYRMPEFGFDCVGRFKASCYGMLLMESRIAWNVREPELQVLNLVTKCCLTLPECPSGCAHKECGSGLGFDPCTNFFKVVHIYDMKVGFEIFTIGGSSNEWKTVPGPWKDLSKRSLLSSGWDDPVSVNGRFLHWNVLSYEYIVSMDVSDEKCIKIKLPYSVESFTDESEFNLVELGGYLACIYSASRTQMEIWILQDFQRKLWLKKHSVHAKMIISSINPVPSFTQICPVGCTSNGVVVFTHTKRQRRMYIYDMKRKAMKKHAAKTKIDKLIVHRSSLFRLQNGSCYKS
ncbi:hypothetical protein DCAR_0830473 [Daucus carota subsp. sativus]|uniref:Uncharacterized protein n=1 Tax=Daucus carota subsp. sativus TaxID=79200 RepID=A0A175YK59_DAUCS|nr:PREDICTED: F-box protein At4g19940-like [Daucus carota subsp. sativus]WOH10996.1 hypothetical protein DCAR_0830473 [Daucus carota subsp. sativus]